MCTQQQLEYLKAICKIKSKSSILKTCPNNIIKALCECAMNALQGNVPLTKKQKSKLSSYKTSLRKLSSKKLPLYKKRQLLIQRGEGFLSILLPAAISVISSLINGVR